MNFLDLREIWRAFVWLDCVFTTAFSSVLHLSYSCYYLELQNIEYACEPRKKAWGLEEWNGRSKSSKTIKREDSSEAYVECTSTSHFHISATLVAIITIIIFFIKNEITMMWFIIQHNHQSSSLITIDHHHHRSSIMDHRSSSIKIIIITIIDQNRLHRYHWSWIIIHHKHHHDRLLISPL